MRGLLLVFAVLCPVFASGQVSFGTTTLIDDGWAFTLGDVPAAKEPGCDDSAWARVDLPYDWSIAAAPRQDLASCSGYLPGGIGWYRKTLVIPRAGGAKVFLYFEGVYSHSEVYVNGHLLGTRPNGYVPLVYDATPYVRFDAENTIAVRVDHEHAADQRWYAGSGIYRDVYLVRSAEIHVAPFGVFAYTGSADADAAQLQIETELQNESGRTGNLVIRHELLAAEGRIVGSVDRKVTVGAHGSVRDEAVLRIAAPRRWSPADPYLYQLRTTVTLDGRAVDQAVNPIGIRTFTFDPNRGFAVNGASTKLKGVCLHDDAGVLGNAVPRIVWQRRLETLKSLGCNAVRMSHNPHAPVVYELCDELGLLVLDEAFDEWEYPKRKWLRGWNVGQPGFEGSAEFFREWAERDLAAMVRAHRNHPSIFAWSIGNEIDYPNDPYSHPVLERARIDQPMLPGYKPEAPNARRLGEIAQRLAAAVRQHDRSRPVTAALAGVVMSNETEYPAALDLVGYNYTEDRYAIDHARYPARIIYGSENRHSASAWRAVEDHDYIAGQFLWTGIDYLGEAGPWPSRGSTSGLLDLSGAIKPRGRFRQALWSQQPVIALGTEVAKGEDRRSIDAPPLWHYEPGELVRVLCYTNAPRARLLLNGKPVGDDQPYDRERGVLEWKLPFARGRLEAIGLGADGKETCRTALTSAAEPAKITVSVDAADFTKRGGVAIVTLQVVDRDGVPVLTARPEITCRIAGPARLLGLESGDIRDMTPAASATRRAYHGRLVAYVQSTAAAGALQLTFSAAGLPDATAAIRQ